jgi:hypothetical protein
VYRTQVIGDVRHAARAHRRDHALRLKLVVAVGRRLIARVEVETRV